jgi:glutathione S-transferase
MTTLHGHAESGSTHRVRLLMHRTGLPHRYVEIDLARGEHRTPRFLELNPFGQVPVLQDAGRTLRDSHAILVYLARVHAPRWLPSDPVAEAEVQAWLSLSAGEVQQSLGRLHLARVHAGASAPEDAVDRGRNVLRLVDHHLRTHRGRTLVGDTPTLADVALFPYLSLALVPRDDLGLTALDDWLEHLRARHGFVPLRRTADAAA